MKGEVYLAPPEAKQAMQTPLLMGKVGSLVIYSFTHSPNICSERAALARARRAAEVNSAIDGMTVNEAVGRLWALGSLVSASTTANCPETMLRPLGAGRLPYVCVCVGGGCGGRLMGCLGELSGHEEASARTSSYPRYILGAFSPSQHISNPHPAILHSLPGLQVPLAEPHFSFGE